MLPALVVLGVGFGMAMPALMAQGMSEATPEDAGLASGLFNTTQQVGGALGLAVLAVLSATRSESFVRPAPSPRSRCWAATTRRI